jgi:hypothetical protein
MTLSLETQIELMAWADGEAGEDVNERVARLLEGSDEARRFVDGWQACQVGDLVSEAMTARLADVPSITDSVMERIEAGPRTASTIPSARRRADRQRLRAWTISVSTGLAVAATIALYFREDSARHDAPAEVAQQVSSSAAARDASSAPGLMPLAAGARGVEVNDIDAVSGAISVFEIPLGAAAANAAKSPGASSVVIWIDEERKAK